MEFVSPNPQFNTFIRAALSSYPYNAGKPPTSVGAAAKRFCADEKPSSDKKVSQYKVGINFAIQKYLINLINFVFRWVTVKSNLT